MSKASINHKLPDTLQALASNLAAQGDRHAVITASGSEIEQLTFEALGAIIDDRARSLAHDGVTTGTPVIVSGPASVEWIVACFAILRCGGSVVPVDTQASTDVFEHIANDSGAHMALLGPYVAERYGPVLERADIRWRDLSAQVSGTGTVASSGDFPSVGPDDRAVLFYTSGTTGMPKGVPLTHRNLTFQIGVIANARLVSAGDRLLLPLPLHHVYPLVLGVFTPLALGVGVVLPDGLTGPRIVAAARDGEATMMIGVPRLYEALIAAIHDRMRRRGRFAFGLFRILLGASRIIRRRLGLSIGRQLFAPLHRQFGPALRTVVSGGAALRPETAWTLEALGWQVASGYGLTETSPLLTINPPGRARFDTTGKPVPGIELRVEPVGGMEGVGEILARGHGVFAGYHKLEDKTAEAFTEDGWLRTGDLGWLDGEGWLHLVGRHSTLIVREGGENVQPDQIEEAYEGHPAIAELAVFERQGAIAGLIVPARQRDDDGTQEHLIRRAVTEISRTLPSYQRIGEYRLTREAIPRTRLGKPRRHLIAELYERAGREETGTGAHTQPVPLDELSGEDQTLLEQDAAYSAYSYLARRFPGRRITPDSDMQLDLGVDSIDWLDLSLELFEQTEVALSGDDIAEIRTVRDLLHQLVQTGKRDRAPDVRFDAPLGSLDQEQRGWIEAPHPLTRRAGHAIAGLNRMVMRLLFGVKAQGRNHVPAEGPFVITPNHTSFLDPFVVASALDKQRLDRIYWAGLANFVTGGRVRRAFARAVRIIPVDPVRAAADSMALGIAVLQRGEGLVWFPEGMRSPSGQLRPFRPGIGLVLEHSSVPIVPTIIDGAFEAWPVANRLPRPRPISVTFLPPAAPEELAAEGAGKTKAERIADGLYRRIRNAIDDEAQRNGNGNDLISRINASNGERP